MNPAELAELRRKLTRRGYFYNPDLSMTEPLLEALQTNTTRYGYPFCPCRLATGNYEQDRSLVCPCDDRDQDINEYGTCYCGLYVSREVSMQQKTVEAIPDRHGNQPDSKQLWRCQVCGYLCSRPHPPDVCPICGVTHDRFEPLELPF